MSCARFQDRLYDEDSRRAQRGHGSVPRDLVEHLAGCADCRLAYDAAVEDERTLTHRLLQDPPAGLRARVLGLLREKDRLRGTADAAQPQGMAGTQLLKWSKWFQWFPVVADSLTAGAVAVALSRAIQGPHPLAWQLATFSAGAALALFRPRFEPITQNLERSLDALLARY